MVNRQDTLCELLSDEVSEGLCQPHDLLDLVNLWNQKLITDNDLIDRLTYLRHEARVQTIQDIFEGEALDGSVG